MPADLLGSGPPTAEGRADGDDRAAGGRGSPIRRRDGGSSARRGDGLPIAAHGVPRDSAPGVSSYDHFRPYLYSRSLRFSFGSMKGRDREKWQQQLMQTPAREGAAGRQGPRLRRDLRQSQRVHRSRQGDPGHTPPDGLHDAAPVGRVRRSGMLPPGEEVMRDRRSDRRIRRGRERRDRRAGPARPEGVRLRPPSGTSAVRDRRALASSPPTCQNGDSRQGVP